MYWGSGIQGDHGEMRKQLRTIRKFLPDVGILQKICRRNSVTLFISPEVISIFCRVLSLLAKIVIRFCKKTGISIPLLLPDTDCVERTDP